MRLRLLAAPLLALVAGGAHAALPGDLPFTRHAPDIDFYPQHFSLTQDASGVVYVANGEGVLVFDGQHWSRVPMPSKDEVRAVAFDGNARVYVGGYNAFGYIERDAAGVDVYTDLTAKFASLIHGEDFAEIWDICVTRTGVFFSALRHVFLYDPATEAVRLWRHDGRFGTVARTESGVVLQFRGEGLRRYDKGEWKPLPGSESLKDLVRHFVPMPAGGQLILSQDGGWQAWRNGRLEPVDMPPGFPPPNKLTAGVPLADGTIAFSSDSGWLYLLDLEHHRFRRSYLEPGYLNDVIIAADGGMLVSGDEAISHVAWPASWSVVGAGAGLVGTAHALKRWGSRWYTLGSAGVQRQADSADGSVRFVPSAWSLTEAWDLLPLDDHSALLANAYSVLAVHDDAVQVLTHNALYPREFLRSRYDPDVVYVGTEPGVAAMHREPDRWKLAAEKSDMQNLRARNLVEAAPHTLWMGSERGGVWRVVFADDDASVRDARRFDQADGIEYGDIAEATMTQADDGTLIALTAKGEFRWTGERFERFDMDGLDRVRASGETVAIARAADGTRWGQSYNHIYRRPGAGAWQREDVSAIRRGAIESISFDDDGAPIFVANNSLLRYDNAAAQAATGAAPQLLLRSVTLQGRDGSQAHLPLASAEPLQLEEGRWSLAFHFAMPDLRRPELVRYSARLKGLDDDFSEWTADPNLVYKRLPPGEYSFELRGRDSQGVETQLAPLAFVIEPQWYDTPWARGLWILVATLALALLTMSVVRWRTLRLQADRARLQLIVAERTTELEIANRRLDSMAHLDGLTGVANRRRLDDYLEESWTQCAARDRKLSLLAIDVDRFKNYNDRHGHMAGDELLRDLVRALGLSIGDEQELLARYGGDEFMVILPGMGTRDAQQLAERMRAEVERSVDDCTVSIGVAERRPSEGGWVAELIGAADAALYRAKAAGRNRVCTEEESIKV
jgi:diguanylate cyclase (GGDEF)-like protein